MKRLLSLLLTFALTWISLSVTASGTEMLTCEEAAELIRGFEEAYMITINEPKCTDYWDIDNKCSATYEQRDWNSNNYKRQIDYYIVPCKLGTYETLLELFKMTFTDDIAKKVLNNSRFIFKDGVAYYPYLFSDPGSTYIIAVDYQDKAEVELSKRIAISQNEDGTYTAEYKYWDYLDGDMAEICRLSDAYTSSVKIKMTESGFRICEYDGLLFKEDPSSDRGFRKYRLIDATSPKTSDSAVYITAAAGVAALCLAVVCRKKLSKV